MPLYTKKLRDGFLRLKQKAGLELKKTLTPITGGGWIFVVEQGGKVIMKKSYNVVDMFCGAYTEGDALGYIPTLHHQTNQ